MDPRHLQGDIRVLWGSMLGSWQIRQMGIEEVEEEWDIPMVTPGPELLV